MGEDKDIRWVARHYKSGRFRASEAWKRMEIATPVRIRRWRAVAAVSGFVFLTAVAAVLYHRYEVPPTVPQQPTVSTPVSIPATPPPAPATTVRVMDFENTPLPQVIRRIREVYGVEILNVPDNADDYRLSLHYEGSASDLVGVINEILDTHMTVESQASTQD